ncbi:class I SAM-dependent methyltransferase [Aeromicrobium sp. Sec7.5]|uniref:class I SAM-dependent methyltransferase n=1 Tax=Aeromicrobium sp. Sec7.5 TaxID=3121276 RepID=UPI002FE44CB9
MTELEKDAAVPARDRLAFGPLDIVFDDSVLVPRPWTIAQSTWARELLESAPAGGVLELCSGAGHIGLASVHATDRRLVQVDRDPHACDLARENAAAAGVAAEIRCGSLSEVLRDDDRFALVIADPPWVPSAGVEVFPDDPVWAIDGGDDGLDVARECVRVAARHLAPDGVVLLQVGSPEQFAQLDDTLRECGLAAIEVRSLAGGALAALRPQ